MADNSKFIQTQTFKLAGGGISLSDTSISLQSFKFPDGNVITMSHIGALGTGTLEPGASKEEIISFTGVTQNGDGSATLTGVTRGLKFGDTAGDYGQNLALRKSHAGNTSFVITNNPQFYNKFAAKDNDEVITGDWQVPTPANGGSIANKDYVNAAVSGSVSTATTSTAGTTRTSKDQASKAKSKAVQAREQDTPDKTLKIESFRLSSIDRIVNYAGGNTPNFIDPGFGGDLAITANPSNTETFVLTVDGVSTTFTAVSSIGATPGNFLIAGSAAATRANLAALINNPTVTNANQVALTGAQLTAIQKMNCTDDLSTNIFIRATNTAVVSVSAVENFAAGGNTWTANITKNRYDLVVIDTSNTLQIRKGEESLSPSAPTPTNGDIVICSVLNRCGMTTVRDYNVSGQSYITDYYDLSVYRNDIALTSSDFIGIFGSGADGSATLDGTTTVAWASKAGSVYTLTRATNLVNLTVNVGVTIEIAGYPLYGNGTLTNNGTIQNNGGAGGAGAVAFTGGTAGAAAVGNTYAAGTAGQTGGAGNGSGAGNPGTAGTAKTSVGSNGVAGGAGGAGGAGAGGGSGGVGGTNTSETLNINTIPSSTAVTVSVGDNAYNKSFKAIANTSTNGAVLSTSAGSGSGGGGGGNGGQQTGGGGGSGGTGGVVGIFFNIIINSATGIIQANGGNGGTGGNGTNGGGGFGTGAGGGGGGGNGGTVFTVYKSYSNLGIIQALGGTGGAGGTGGPGGSGSGANGVAGTAGTVGKVYRVAIS